MSVSDKLPSNSLGRLHMKIYVARQMNMRSGDGVRIKRTAYRSLPPSEYPIARPAS